MNIFHFKKNLTVLILCGGKGLRLRPLTKDLPKPLVKIKNKSILENIINHFLKFKINDLIIASGYKHKMIDKFIKKKFNDKRIRTIYTGINSDIIERIKIASKYSKKYLLVCYGDTIIDLNLNKYIQFYSKNLNKITVASYQLESSFGIFKIKKKDIITNFQEKPLLDIWFNVGYIFFSSKKFHFFDKFNRFKDLIKFLSKRSYMKTFKHYGNHITVNTLAELEKAKKISNKIIK